MRKLFIAILALSILVGIGFAAAAADPYTMQVKKLYSAPDENSNLIYNIPIDVQLLDVSNDGNWYKVKISFNLGPLGYTYVGWANIPVGEILAARTEKVAKVPVEPPKTEE